MMLTPEQLAWYRANHGYDGGPMKPLCDHIDAQQARIAELERDAARIDWLADTDNEIGQVLLPTECVTNNLGSLRDAIDAAMQK